MNTTTSTKKTDEGTLPKRDPKSGRFEKGKAKPTAPAKPVVDKVKPTTPAKPVAGTAKKG